MFEWTRSIAAAIGVWWLIVTFTPLVQWWARQLANPWGPGTGDVLVVLGGDTFGDGILGGSSYLRAVYTIRAMRANHFQKVIFTGGSNTGEKPALAELMRDFVQGHGIDTSNVTVETESTSTEENVLKTAPLLRATSGRVMVLTSDYHAYRANRVFLKQGLKVEMWPVPDVLKRYNAWPARAGLFIELSRETAKLAWYKWKGWI